VSDARKNVLLQDLAAATPNAMVGGPFGSNLLASDYVSEGVPVIRGENVSIGRWVQGDFVYVSEDKANRLSANTARAYDIIFTQRGANHYRQVGIVRPETRGRLIVSQSQMKLTVDRQKADPIFIYYLFMDRRQQAYLQRNAIQTGVPHTNLSILRRVPLEIPPLEEQHAIAGILGTLDDRIELNARTGRTLEGIGRALFKSWFVDFQPTTAKAERRPTSVPRPLADLFPDRLVASELGTSPEGWPVVSLGDLCRRVAMGPFGSDIKTDNFVDAGVPVIRGGNLTRGFIDDGFVFVSEQKADELRNANAFPGDIAVTHRGTLGQVGLIPPGSRFRRYVVSQSQMLLSADLTRTTARYLFEFLISPRGQHALLSNASQTGVPAIARPTTSLRAIRLLAPPAPVLAAFDRLTEPLFSRALTAERESRTLAALRDTLLPKLMSGELRLKSAERLIEATA